MTCALYRHYDADGQLLYVGMTANLGARMQAHFANSPWAERVNRIDVEYFASKEEALEAEARAITAESPKLNCQHGQRKRGASPKKSSGSDNSELLAKIDAYLKATGETQSSFGRRAANDYGLIPRLRSGHEPRSATIRKIKGAMQEATA